MTAVAVSVASRDCKTPGCAGESMHARGPYAGLCLACTAVQRKRISQINRESAKGIAPEVKAARSALAGRARPAASGATGGVRDVTRRLEVAAAHLEKARQAEAKAMRAARAARDARLAAEQRIGELRAELDVALGLTAVVSVRAAESSS